MAKFDFRILLETVEGRKTSYMSQSFVDTSVDLVLSSSQVYNRITGSVSCSYQNNNIFSQSSELTRNDVNTLFTFKNNNLLSASISGSAHFGFIEFNATDTQYDRLKRYKFFGEKVCNTLGLPNNQWIYVDQARFPSDDEKNYIEGNIKAETLFIEDNISFSPTANISSDLKLFNDTGSDKYIRIVDTRIFDGTGSLFFGYDEQIDTYEIGSDFGLTPTFRIRGLDEISASRADMDGDTNRINIKTANLNVAGRSGFELNMSDAKPGAEDHIARLSMDSAGKLTLRNFTEDQDLILRTKDFSNAVYIDDSTERVGINTSSPDELLHVAGNLKVDGEMQVVGAITSSIISSSILFTSGSNIFGDTITDTHLFNGHITASGNISASGASSVFGGIIVDQDIVHNGDSNTKIRFTTDNVAVSAGGNITNFELTGIDVTGRITASNGIKSGGDLVLPDANASVKFDGGTKFIGDHSSDGFQIRTTDSDPILFKTNGNNIRATINDEGLSVNGHITASKNISASGNINTSGSVTNRVQAVDGTGLQLFEDGGSGIFIKDGGRVGIGTTNPGGQLEVTTTGIRAAEFTSDNDAPIMVESTDGTTGITFKDNSAEQQIYYRGNRDSFYIETPTKLGLGTNDPLETLDVRGSASFSGNVSGSFTSTGSFGRVEANAFTITDSALSVSTLTTSGNISGSVTSTGSFGRVQADGTVSAEHLESLDDLFVTDNVTIGGELVFGNSQDHAIGINQPGGNTDGRKLAISASNANIATSGNFKGGNIELQGGAGVGSGDDGDIILNGREGNVGIGATSPGQKLEVIGNISSSGIIFTSNISSSGDTHTIGEATIRPVTYANNQDGFLIRGGASNNDSWDGHVGVKFKSTSGGVPYLVLRATNSDTLAVRQSKVGIGTESPSNILHVKSDENQLARFESNDDDAKIVIKDNDTTGFHNVRDGFHSFGFDGFSIRSPLFVVSGSEDSNGVHGKVGIGTKNVSDSVLTVLGDISASGGIFIDDFQVLTGDGSDTTLSASGDILLNTGDDVFIRNDGSNYVRFDGTNQNVMIGTATATGKKLTVRGSITASGDVITQGHITASGNISSSGGSQHYLGGKLSIGQNTGTTTTEGVLQVAGDIFGKKVNVQYSELKRFGGLYFTWDGDSYGTNKQHSIRSIEDNTRTDSLTFNSFDKMMFNIDSNDNNDNSFFRIGHHGTGSSDSIHILDLDDEFDFTLYRSGSSLGAGTINFHIDGTAGNITASGNISSSGTSTASFGKLSFKNDDFQIYSDGTNSFISEQGGSGNLKLLTSQIQIKNAADNENIIRGTNNGSVELFHNNSLKLETTTTGIDVTGDISSSGTFFLGSDSAETHAIQGVSSLTANGGGFIGNSNGIIRGGSSEAIKHFFCGYLDEGDGGTFEQMFIDVYGGMYLASAAGVTKYQITSRGDDQEGDYEIYRQRYGSFTQDPKFDLLILRKADEDFKRYAVFVVSTSTSFPNFSVRAWKLTNDTTNQMQEIRVKQFDSGSFPGYSDGESFVERYNTLEVNRNDISGSAVSTGSFGRVDIADKLFVGGSEVSSGGSTNAAGSDTQVQFNDGGTNFGGDAGLVFNKTTNTLTAGAITSSGGITAGGNISASGTITGLSGSLSTLTVDDITINDSTISDSGNFTLDVGGDISVEATGKDISFTNGVGTPEFIFNLESAPELDVDGNFTIDGSGDIKLDSANNVVDLVGNVTASGNISASGAILGKQVDVKFHAYNDTGTGENFIPAMGTREATVVGGSAYYTEWIAPYDGQIEKVIVTTSTDAGSTAVKFRIDGGIKATQTLTVNANTPTTFSTLNNHPSTTADRTFSAGDILQISIDPTTTGTNIQVTSVWVYNIDSLTL